MRSPFDVLNSSDTKQINSGRARKPARAVLAIISAALILAHSPAHAADGASLAANIPDADRVLTGLRKEHPRLLAAHADFALLKSSLASQPEFRALYAKLLREGDKILTERPSKYEIPDGLRLLATSRRVLHRVYTLGLLYRQEGDARYAERLWKELETAAAFPDWNPRHFLDTAEMTHAFAIGYDWLFDKWTDEQKRTLKEAMIEKGLRPALKVYASNGGWHRSKHNWNQVCNGGIGIGALALADDEPALAAEALKAALDSLPLAMAEFAPDGAWSEGPGYWNYATQYNVAFLAALQTALGTDFGLSAIPAFNETGTFPIYLTGPIGRTFNYADGGDGLIRAPQMFWLARQFNRPEFAWYQRQIATPNPLDILWYSKAGSGPPELGVALDRHFRGAEIVTMRSGWEDRQALFAGFKAGDNKANHSHLDLGSFVFDALGVRWAVDLGADDYNMPGYFGKERWNYYRLRAEGQNTLVINPGQEPDQDPRAAGQVVKFRSEPRRSFGVMDLTEAYKRHASKVMRGIALLNRRALLVQDEIQAPNKSDIWWFMHTATSIDIAPDGRSATLSQGGAKLEARLLSPAKGQFEKMRAQPLPSSPQPDMQSKNAGISKLAVHLPDTTETRICVLLVPGAADGPIDSVLGPLDKW